MGFIARTKRPCALQMKVLIMSLNLPFPIERYFDSEKSDQTEALSECFAADATVIDEARTHKGLEAIKAWRADTKSKFDYRVLPQDVKEEDGRTIVATRVEGNFPGSPVVLNHVFRISEGRIASLEIRP